MTHPEILHIERFGFFGRYPEVICTCGLCEEVIYEGDEYYDTPDGDVLCEVCVDNMSIRELMEFVGCEKKTAVAA